MTRPSAPCCARTRSRPATIASSASSAVSERAMPSFRTGEVVRVLEERPGLQRVEVDLGCGPERAYVMTHGAGLPLALSDLVHALRSKGLLDATVTCGHAFGGDFEAVSIYSALAVARHAARADAAVVAMGPGIVGTNTRLGFSGMEVGPILDAAAALGGAPIACLRVSFADTRARHAGLSHHTRTAL